MKMKLVKGHAIPELKKPKIHRYIHVYTHIYTFVCTDVYVRVVCLFVCLFVRLDAYLFVSVCVYSFVKCFSTVSLSHTLSPQ
eukprot:m.28266 g.28266  ORF g.28266 m.28266 type:complete len:82 (+) comp15891_c0_seq1:333-578(+)